MLTTESEAWLLEKFPKLVVMNNEINGVVEFTATYNNESDKFLIIEEGTEDVVGGVRLSGSFEINIKERTDIKFSHLPALYIKNADFEFTRDRHINIGTDKSACLCSPFEEPQYLLPELQFALFFEHLIIPFLYGQLFYTKAERWPWKDLAHGSIGLLESYSTLADPSKANACVEMLKYSSLDWPKIQQLLKQKAEIKGHIECLCASRCQIRNCHPIAWKGIRQLQCDLKAQKILVP
jgi:hypothetical protein